MGNRSASVRKTDKAACLTLKHSKAVHNDKCVMTSIKTNKSVKIPQLFSRIVWVNFVLCDIIVVSSFCPIKSHRSAKIS
jgi:hypothetical protein